jgi:hypothetical protein
MQFDITFKNEKERNYLLIAFFFVVLHALFFIYLLFDEKWWKQGVAGLVIIALYSLYRLLVSKTHNQSFFYGEGIFFLFQMFFITVGWWWLAGLEMIVSILCFALLQKRSIYFNSYVIEHKTRPYKRYKWSDLSNVVLKDNIITLDFKNNKLIQGEINTSVDENIFNAFVNEQLNKSTIKSLND